MKTKTRFQKLTAWLLTLAMLITFIPSFTLTASADTITSGTSGTISYTIDSDGVLTFTGSGTIPQYFYNSINGNHRNLVKRIVIENGITSIGTQALDAFYNVTSVSIAQSVTSISSYAFQYDRNIKTITYWGTKNFTSTNILNSSVTPKIYVKTNYSYSKMFGKGVTKILTDTSKECTVKFDMNGYGTQVESQYVFNIDGYNKVTKPTDPSAPEVKFEGWYKDSEFNTAWNFDTDTVSDNTTIYAKWNTTPDHTVSFDMGLYGAAIGDRGVVNDSLIAEPETPTDSDALFLGWYKDSGFDNPWDFANDTVTSDTTLYAKWRLWYGTAPSTGDGSESSPFEIGTVDELYWLADYYNNSTALSEAHAILTADITVNQNVLKTDGTLNGDGSAFRAWQPIGNSSIRYVGTFDGQGHTISGLYFNNTDTTEGQYVGFIGRLGAGTVKNLEVADSYFKGYKNVGGIVGSGQSSTASYVENCKSSATVYASYQYAGGISGNYSTITNCLFVGKAGAPSKSYLGAILGSYQYQYLKNCYYLQGSAVCDEGNVQYGVGTNGGNSNSNGNDINYFAVSTNQLASGEIAYKLQGAQEDDSVVVWGQQLTGENIDAYPTLGGPRVVLDTATGTYINSEEGSSHTRVRGYCCDEDYDEPVLVDGDNYTSLGLTSDYIGYYAISNYGQLYGFAKIVNNGDYDANAVLTDNIIANENVLKADGSLNGDGTDLWQWNPILPAGEVESSSATKVFSGIFDGNNKYISGLYYNNSVGAVRGLFGYIGAIGVVKNLGIVDSYFYGQRAVGAIAGYNLGTIEDCYNESTIKVYPKSSTGMMNDSGILGGIIGYNEGTIKNCYNKGYISGSNIASDVGGIAGLTSKTIDNCYNSGKIEGDGTVAGIVGSLYDATVSNCYNTGYISGRTNLGGIVGFASNNNGVAPTVKESWNSGTVFSNHSSNDSRYAGGIVGRQSGQYLIIKDCYNMGTISTAGLREVGGIVGYAYYDAVVETSYNYGDVIGKNYVGAVVGRIGVISGSVNDDDITITNCYYLEECAVDSNETVQNGVGNETAGSTTADVAGETTALTLEQMTDDTNWKTNFAGFDTTTVWSKDNNTAGAWYLPKLDSNSPSVVPPHTHEWRYTANGSTITTECGIANCPIVSETLTISAPQHNKYGDGKDANATLSVTQIGDFAISNTDIVYTKGNETLTAAPTDAGTYKASITVDTDKIAFVEYTIAKADAEIPTGLTSVYGRTLNDITLPDGWTWANPMDSVGNVGNQTHKVNYEGDNNYNAASNVDVTVTVSQSGASMTAYANKNEYTYGEPVTITVNGIIPTGEASVNMFSLTAPVANQVAIWNGDTQLTEPQTVNGGALTFEIPNLTVGEYTLTAKFTGNDNMASTSASVTLVIKKATPSYTTPGELKATYGDTLNDVILPTADNGVWSWASEGDSVGNAGTQSHSAIFTPNDTINYEVVNVNVSVTVDKAVIGSADFNVTAPEAGAVPQTAVTAGTGYSAEIAWNETAEKFGFNTAYTATVTLTADSNYKFADNLSKDGWTVALNNDKSVATFTKTFDATRKQKIESVTSPTNVNLDSHKSDAAAVIATLPTTVLVALEENATDNLAVEWSCANFNTAPLSENTFTWTATNSKYDSNNVELTGTITVANPAANAVSIIVKTENTTVVYNVADIDLTSLFDIDTNAGNATYTVTNGTGAGTQNGTALSVTKAGTFTVKVDTAANGIYAVGTQSATLTVEKANGTGAVSMEGWTYGETAKETVVSDNKGAATYQYKIKGSDDSTYSPDKPSNAGEYTVKATFAETDLYKETTATADFTIAKAQAVISVDTTPIVKTYGDTWELPTATTNFGIVSADKTVAEMANAGEYTVTYTVVGDDNFNGATKTVSVTINPKKIDKPSADNTSFVYDGNEHTYNVAASDYYTITGNKRTDAGSQNVIVALNDMTNYAWNNGGTADVTFTFTIAKKDITGATVGNFEEITYTGGVQTPFATVTIDGLIVTGTWSAVTNVADKTTFTANGNFTGTIADKETGMLKTNSSVATVPGANALTYSETAQELVTAGVANGGTLKYSLDNATWADAIPTGTNADTYEVWYKVFGDANHNDTDSVKVDVTIAKKSIEAATVALDGTLAYNGDEQTQNVTVTLDGFTVTFDVTNNKATNVKADGNYTLKVTANGNFEGEKTLEWNIAKGYHIIEGENIPTASRIRRGNKLSTSTITPAELKDADGNVLGTFIWVTPDDEMTETGDFVKQVKFTPTDTTNYNEKTFDVAVNVYRPSSGGGGSSSNTTTTTTKNEDGSTTKVTENKTTGTKTEVTTNTDGSTTTVETKKDGTVTTTEKDKDGNTVTTVEKSDGTSTTTEKNKDGSEKVTEKSADGTTVTTEKDTDGTKTVTTENADGSTTTEETKKDGTKVTTQTSADGETKTEIDLPKDKKTDVTIPIDSTEDVTSINVTDKDGNETEITDFEITENGVKVTVSGDCTAVINKAAKKEFVDVHPVNHWATADIDYAYIKGLMMGTSETHFSPDVPLTRAMLVTVLYRLEGEPATNRSIPFADVDMGAYYANAVSWAKQNGIVNGVTETEFAPNDNITREQIAAIMHRYAQYKGYDVSVGENTNILSYDDFDSISEYAIPSMQWAVGSGLIKGKSESTLNPLDNATRAEIAAILHRFIKANK